MRLELWWRRLLAGKTLALSRPRLIIYVFLIHPFYSLVLAVEYIPLLALRLSMIRLVLRGVARVVANAIT